MQEGLANALKHANGAHAEVTVRYAGNGVEVEVADDGLAPNGSGRVEGYSLVGMRERVALYGGTLETGPRDGGGFVVRAQLPVGGAAVIRVLLVDDQALVRAGFRMILDAEHDIEVVGEAADGRDAIDQVRSLRPDVVLMDIRMPELDGLEAARRILADGVAGDEPPRLLMLTTFDRDEYVYEALRAGASGFLLKDTPPEQLVAAIHVVAAGDALLVTVDHETRHRGVREGQRPEAGGAVPARSPISPLASARCSG